MRKLQHQMNKQIKTQNEQIKTNPTKHYPLQSILQYQVHRAILLISCTVAADARSSGFSLLKSVIAQN